MDNDARRASSRSIARRLPCLDSYPCRLKRPRAELPPKRGDIIEIDAVTKVVALDIEPKELRPGEVGIIRGRPPTDAR